MEDRSPLDSPPQAQAVVPDALLNDVELRGTIAIQIYKALASKPKSTMRELAQVLDCTERTISRNLDRLEQKGWITRLERSKGRPNSYEFPRALGLAG